ncbi:MAG TPA: hypothetical protein H9815_03435 [Candidatus Ruania gallistercoris]|uniref:Small multidrug efflux protein n=1 Tax=Candidatus Ruania gallistercoris TaxID=2838746 RepID=A0A9D2J3E2_9MICO|nr:hypothetical protein [Candidatus Ruania gallistercoris]
MLFDFVTDLFVNLTQFVLGLESWQQIAALVLVGAVPFIESYLGSFLGVLVGIEPMIAVPAAVVGNVLCTFLLIATSSRVRTAATRSSRPGSTGEPAAQPTGRRQKVAKYLDRFGVPGVALLGPIVVASQITAPTLVALGATTRSVYLWMGLSIILWGVAFGFFGTTIAGWLQ